MGYKGGFEVQPEFAAKTTIPQKYNYWEFEFIEHGTVDELQEYCKIDVKSLEIVFLLSQNNYFALNTMRL
jgi:1-deoxy-D-xylulose-5-phosphate synthase